MKKTIKVFKHPITEVFVMVFISVVIPAHIKKEYLLDAVNSALNQTLSRDKYEIIVIKNFPDYDEYLSNSGVIAINTNKKTGGEKIIEALKISRGEIISFLDYDDIFLPHKLEMVYKIFSNDDKVGYYRNRLLYFRDGDNIHSIIKNIKYTKKIIRIKNEEKEAKFKLMMENSAYINNSTISLRKDILLRFIENNPHKYRNIIDNINFYISLMSNYDVVLDPNVLTLYRVSKNNFTFGNSSYGINDFQEWVRRKINYLEMVIDGLYLLTDIVKNNYIYLKYDIYPRLTFYKCLSSLLPTKIDKKYKLHFRDLKYANKKKTPLFLFCLTLNYAPASIKRLFAMKAYKSEVKVAENLIGHEQ
ncbi:glycosyltransferase family 2 protein [Acidianus sp. HS-5]|uniref:glycosyltransferase family 2 protein n=1 Tax=Acidianus sp. HS-5 TaxID=2886040 RepID=UPI001F294E90|nr:glycosyltransferase family 2 protein [Acidianus sp. HS-5]BDC17401.1 hypothetical protein HS5_02910 [Acidianus sp. HS-5]